mgnify:FL=1
MFIKITTSQSHSDILHVMSILIYFVSEGDRNEFEVGSVMGLVSLLLELVPHGGHEGSNTHPPGISSSACSLGLLLQEARHQIQQSLELSHVDLAGLVCAHSLPQHAVALLNIAQVMYDLSQKLKHSRGLLVELGIIGQLAKRGVGKLGEIVHVTRVGLQVPHKELVSIALQISLHRGPVLLDGSHLSLGQNHLG